MPNPAHMRLGMKRVMQRNHMARERTMTESMEEADMALI
jgi:hypothetical protein